MKETKIAECINPERPCKSCTYSFNPALFDGGCMLYAPTGDRANLLEAPELETASKPEGDSKSLQA